MTPTRTTSRKKTLALIAVIAAVGVLAYMGWTRLKPSGPGEGFVSGNGRIEATEIDIATKLSGRLEQLLVREGDFVTVGQPLARMQLDTLHAQRDEADASRQQAEHGVAAAEAQVALREADHAAAQALIALRAAELDAAQRRLTRSQTLSKEGAASVQELDDDRAKVRGAEAALNAARAQAAAAQAAVRAAQAQMVGARSGVKAATATEARVEADIRDSELTAPRDGRIQFRVAQAGEVLGAGGRVLNLLDLSDVYMTFFVPETVAGRIALGSEVRIVLDASLGTVVPASVSFVASQAQFTPKTVETASERTKLMFRVRAQIAPELLRRNLEQVKTGVPGVAWIKLDPNAAWPASLSAKVAE
ncbi:HlyD family secretion protein [Rhodoferax ferrireducens]|uniref:HlyD family secretion protein n=1 Tax=Rhodoferax ferrireducens TaxID=192843 RepID=UPI000E0D5D19|nr:efflux RND transporter periplasmic adaptor subunit [Rhodoferax ferrireducens]